MVARDDGRDDRERDANVVIGPPGEQVDYKS